MMTKILEYTKKHRVSGVVVRMACYILMKLIYFKDMFFAFFRNIGVSGVRYKRLRSYKDCAKGKRCFIICTGPSLTLDDCEKLRNENTFCMNSFCKVMGKTSFRPTYYGIQDVQVYKDLEKDINRWFQDTSNVLIADRITKRYKTNPKWIEFPLCYSYNSYDRWFNNVFKTRFSPNAYSIVYDEFSITHSLIQIAVYMGYTRIYLLGADCNFSKDRQIHFVDHGIVDSQLDTSRDRNIAGYLAVKEYCEKKKINVYNSTRGGQLEVFPRVKLEDVLEEKA